MRATYPRDERPGYQLLKCGHYTDKASILFYSVWAPKDKRKLYCDKCHKWVPKVKVTSTPEDTTISKDTLF